MARKYSVSSTNIVSKLNFEILIKLVLSESQIGFFGTRKIFTLSRGDAFRLSSFLTIRVQFRIIKMTCLREKSNQIGFEHTLKSRI